MILGFSQKKGRDGVTLRPKSREETPRKGSGTSLSREAGYGSAKFLNQEVSGKILHNGSNFADKLAAEMMNNLMFMLR